VFFNAVWWAVAVAMAAAFSQTIYGLRKAVSDIRRLGQYTLEEKLGEGGMGVVYRASHAMLRRPTAIKLLLPDRNGKEALTRFEREVRRTAMLTHPNTVTVFDYGRTTEGVFYYAMELLEGASLEEIVELDGPQPEERVIHLLEQAAGSLAEAHDAGLIHRDVKPGNILVVDRGGISDQIKVLDFGLVKDVGAGAGNGAASEPALTMADTITGTPLYVAPETVIAPETVDARTDLYSLGAVGYWLLTGTHVFDGRSVVEVLAHHVHSVPDRPSKRLGAPVSSDLEAVLLECLAKRPDDRPASAHVLRERLHACESAGRWTNARAAQWWSINRQKLRSAGTRPAAAAGNGALHRTVARIAE
jgi:serine/threonine-protein kinase